MNKRIYSCENHIEDLLDVYLDEVEQLPVLEKITTDAATCSECQETATYLLSESEVDAIWE